MEDEWMVFDMPTKIVISNLYPVIKEKLLEPVYLHLTEFAFKNLDTIDSESPRYINADIGYPLIAVEGLSNPSNKKYRMIDGRHRLLKQLNEGKTEFLFYVLPFNSIKHYIERM